MPKVISYTPPWLSRPAPGASIFASSGSKSPEHTPGTKDVVYSGPTRIQAKRGNELFTVVDNQIRWSSLTRLKDEWQHNSRSNDKQQSEDRTVQYRVGQGLTVIYCWSEANLMPYRF